jgi:hypothetical protein
MEGDKVHPMGRRQRKSPPHRVSSDVEGVRVSAIKVFNMVKLSNESGTRPGQKKKRHETREIRRTNYLLAGTSERMDF